MFAFAFGLATRARDGSLLDVYYPLPVFQPEPAIAAALSAAPGGGKHGVVGLTDPDLESLARAFDAAGADDLARTARGCQGSFGPCVLTVLEQDAKIEHIAEAYLKLHLLSWRRCLPNSLNLDGIFAVLPNVAWTSAGPVALADVGTRTLNARARGESLKVYGVDKFPPLLDYVVPSGVRIGDGSRIRLGAYLGEGTTVMHEGFVNFNAGTVGPGMIEGRISQGVIVGAHSDLGGSSSTMGTLSGGGTERISIGENCLIGANAGTGIALGDRCIIEAGLYITAATPVALLAADGTDVKVVKARELSGQSDLLFLRNGRNGRVECRSNRTAVQLNEDLHAHN